MPKSKKPLEERKAAAEELFDQGHFVEAGRAMLGVSSPGRPRGRKPRATTPEVKPREDPAVTQRWRDEKGRLLPGHPYTWKKGASANPSGTRGMSSIYRDFMTRIHPTTGKTGEEAIAEALIALAMNGDVNAARELRQATEGDRQLHEFLNKSEEELDRLIEELSDEPRQLTAGEEDDAGVSLAGAAAAAAEAAEALEGEFVELDPPAPPPAGA